jgi:acyl-coenzyme A thioesterase PaaI-like protein
MVDIRTHLEISSDLCGRATELSDDSASVELQTTDAMKADDRGLVHGGFVFGALDYAAMLAVNDPNVVLGAADLRFVAPVRVGETVRATATVESASGKKRILQCVASVGEKTVLKGTLTAFVLEKHVLDG